MSDYRAVAGVTAALQQLLHGPASTAVPGATTRAGVPTRDPLAGASGLVNIFLYQVNPNPSWRNAELPVRRADGSILRRPQAALDLYYLISFYGDESRFVPQLLLGATVAALHAQPTLRPEDIPSSLGGGDFRGSGLPDQAAILNFTPVFMTQDEISRLWSVLVQVPYALSVAYMCSVVLIEADLDPEPALPAVGVQLGASPWEPVRVDRVLPQTLEYSPGAVLRVEGGNLAAAAGAGIAVSVGGSEARPLATADGALEVTLPAEIEAGVQTVRVGRRAEREGSREPAWSAAAAVVVLPTIDGEISVRRESRSRRGRKEEVNVLTVPIAPPPGRGQRPVLLLNEWRAPSGRPPRSYRLEPAAEVAPGDGVRFPAPRVESGEYLARITVGGVTSLLAVEGDAASPHHLEFTRPRVRIP